MADKIKFIIKEDNLKDLVSKISDLTKISDIVKFKIDEEDTFIYSLVGETAILAFKSFQLKTKDYFTFKDEFDYTLDYIVLNAKKFVKNLTFFETDIKATFSYRDSHEPNVKYVRGMQALDGRFKVNNIGAEPFKVRDITKQKLNALLNIDNSKWGFEVSSKDFEDITKLSKINNDEDIVTISTSRGKVSFGEMGTWDLKICDYEGNEDDITFPKKYLSSIKYQEEVLNFTVFDTFILFKEGNVNLMVSFEQT